MAKSDNATVVDVARGKFASSSLSAAASLRRQPTLPEKTVIITGAPRGGTSFAASLVFALGVPMRRPDDPSVLGRRFSHRALMKAFKLPDKSDFLALCKSFNEGCPIWGAKLTARNPVQDLAFLKENLRNACFVIILKKPFAVTQRSLAMRGEKRKPVGLAKTVLRTTDYYRDLLKFAIETDAPVLLLSYELAMKNRPQVLKALSKFLGVQKFDKKKALRIIDQSWDSYFRVATGFAVRRTKEVATREPIDASPVDPRQL